MFIGEEMSFSVHTLVRVDALRYNVIRSVGLNAGELAALSKTFKNYLSGVIVRQACFSRPALGIRVKDLNTCTAFLASYSHPPKCRLGCPTWRMLENAGQSKV